MNYVQGDVLREEEKNNSDKVNNNENYVKESAGVTGKYIKFV